MVQQLAEDVFRVLNNHHTTSGHKNTAHTLAREQQEVPATNLPGAAAAGQLASTSLTSHKYTVYLNDVLNAWHTGTT